ncbi:MAG: dTDP-glucose 4,6-dehydratase [Candidatus Melainabacteria bacterium]|nr:dTDP-glucose 4,6-dehydratase [Candidatus Melainabacteria bacterium]
MHIIVTGGLGFIGSNFIRHLLSESKDVFITNIDAQTYAGRLDNLKDIEGKKNYQYFKGNIQDYDFIENTFKTYKPDCIINFAAETHVDRSIEKSQPFIETNIVGTHVLLEVSLKQKLKKYIQISTDEVYGSVMPPDKFTESSPIKPNSPYSASKAAADHLVRAYNKTYGLNTTIIRCSNNFGPYQFPEKVIPYFISLALENKKVPVYGDGLNVRDWIYVLDFCKAISLVLEKDKPGEIYNVGGDYELTNLDLTKTLLKRLGKGENLISFVEDRLGHDRRYAMDSSKIKKELSWEKKYSFEEALDKTINWYKNNKEWIERRTKQYSAVK